MTDKKALLIREIENDVEDIFCNHDLGDDDYYDFVFNELVKDDGRTIYRIDVNTSDRQIWALEKEEDFTLTLDELGEEALGEIEEILADGRYRIA